MKVRLARFSFGPGKLAEAQALADDLAPQIRALPGCSGVHFYGDAGTGDYGFIVLWDSQGVADAAATVIGPQLSAYLDRHATGAADIRLFDVLSD